MSSRLLTLLAGSGVSAAAFSPLAYNPDLWISGRGNLYSDLGTTAATDGGTIEQANDRSPNARNLTRTTLASRPLFSAASPINGLPAIKFTGYTTNLGRTSDGVLFTSGFSLFVAFYLSAVNNSYGRTAFFGMSDSTGGMITNTPWFWVNTSDLGFLRNGTTTDMTSLAVATAKVYIAEFHCDVAVSGTGYNYSNQLFGLNGATSIGASDPLYIETSTQLMFGPSNDSNSDSVLYVSDLLYFPRLSTAQAGNVRGYLNSLAGAY